jgi:hypothetical protein
MELAEKKNGTWNCRGDLVMSKSGSVQDMKNLGFEKKDELFSKEVDLDYKKDEMRWIAKSRWLVVSTRSGPTGCGLLD